MSGSRGCRASSRRLLARWPLTALTAHLLLDAARRRAKTKHHDDEETRYASRGKSRPAVICATEAASRILLAVRAVSLPSPISERLAEFFPVRARLPLHAYSPSFVFHPSTPDTGLAEEGRRASSIASRPRLTPSMPLRLPQCCASANPRALAAH